MKQKNQIQTLTEKTVDELTTPMKLTYVALQPEQMNLLAQTMTTIGRSTARSMDLLSELPTQDSLDEMMRMTVRDNLYQTRQIVLDGQNRGAGLTRETLNNQTETLRGLIHSELKTMTQELKARDLTPWKIRLKWALIGAILPSMACIWQLISG